MSDSIAIIADAIHLITDLIGFATSFLFIYLSKFKPTTKLTFGYHRMELLGALGNLFIIWVLVIFVFFEATERITNKAFVEDPFIMLITASAGLVINIVMYKILHGADHSHGLLSDGCQGHGHDDHDHAHPHDDKK
jgi:zinc transporter 2